VTRRTGGRSLEQIAEELRRWVRRRLRAVQLKQWKRGPKIYQELRRLGATPERAAQVAGNAQRWWRNSTDCVHSILTVTYFDRLGVPKFS
ncbi:MAG: group intron reverse transcriptase/maturase, partial [Pseudomonadota bacterium]